MTVSQVAERTRLTVRTLHHYDRIGLVKPSARSGAGYRLYAPDDLLRLQQVLFFRELGFELAAIRKIMAARTFEREHALAAQRSLLIEKADRVQSMIATIDRTLQSIQRGETFAPDPEEFDMFKNFDPRQYEEEARKRWGHTDSYKESKRRTDACTKEDWKRIQAEAARISADLAALLEAGVPAEDARATALAEEHRLHIDRTYYPCSHRMHEGLGDMYVSDPRFTATYDAVRPGLAVYLRDAIRANARGASKFAV